MIRLGIILVLMLPLLSFAHKPSDSYLFLNEKSSESEPNSKLAMRWDIALRDLQLLIGLDRNGDRNITWAELKQSKAQIYSQALSHLTISSGNQSCSMQAETLMVDNHSDGTYASIGLLVDCDGKQASSIHYNLLFEQDPDHRGILIDQRFQSSSPLIFSNDRQVIDVISVTSLWNTFLDYIEQGIWHIWMGFDHVLFIVTLMLPSVLSYRNRQWIAVKNPAQASRSLFKVITAFTIAHSLTLSLSILGIVSLPSRLVESMIAVSIVVVAINNLKPVFNHARWILAFVFGLMHGFGFASVLVDLGLPAGSLATSLLAFNLGVEAGQLMILAILFPLAWLIRDRLFYRRFVLQGGSVVASLFALVWVVERTLNIQTGLL